MRFNFLALTTALLTASAVHGAPQPELVPRTSPTDVTQTLGILTSAVGNINAIVTQINGLTAIILAPVAVQALGGLIGAVQLATLGLNLGGGALPIPSATDQASICAALGTVSSLVLLSFSFSLSPPPRAQMRVVSPPQHPWLLQTRNLKRKQCADCGERRKKLISFWMRSQA